MWAHYKRTFLGMQVTIATITAAVYMGFGHQWRMAMTFFLVMQFSSMTGAIWASRITAMMNRRAEGLIRPRR